MEGLLSKDTYEEKDINELKKHDLERILKHHGISARGTKDELQVRILNISSNDDEALTDTAASTPHKKKRERKEPEAVSEELLNKKKYLNKDIDGLHVDQLKQILKKNNLHVTGKKEELIDRILTSIPNNSSSITVSVPKSLKQRGPKQSAPIIVTDAGEVSLGKKGKWSSDEEQALRDGLKVHGKGNWSSILQDPSFSDILKGRTGVNLKDKVVNWSKAGAL